jgi:uncharacterized membrane protein
MTDLPLHPAIVHLPLGLAIALPLLAAAVALGALRGWWSPRAWWLVVGLQGLLLAGTGAAWLTGEADEDRVEETRGEALVEAHEEAAGRFLGVAGVAGVLALAGALLPAGRGRAAALVAAHVALLAAGGQALVTGHAGGELVHGGTDGAQRPTTMARRAHDDDDD